MTEPTPTFDVRDRTVDLRALTQAIIAQGVEAQLFQSGGMCATIGIGPLSPSFYYDEDSATDFPYLVGPGNYYDCTAWRGECSSGPNRDASKDEWETQIGETESVEDYAQRLVAAYRLFAAECPEAIGPTVRCVRCGRLTNDWHTHPAGKTCDDCHTKSPMNLYMVHVEWKQRSVIQVAARSPEEARLAAPAEFIDCQQTDPITLTLADVYRLLETGDITVTVESSDG